MSEDIYWIGLFLVCAFAMGWTFSCSVTHAAVDDYWRMELAKRGCAEFYLDDNHDRQWRWKDGK